MWQWRLVRLPGSVGGAILAAVWQWRWFGSGGRLEEELRAAAKPAADDCEMAEGRKAYDGDYGPPVTLGAAFHFVAREVARQNAAIAVQVAAGRAHRDPKDILKDKKERTTFNVKLPDGTKKAYKILPGGNPDCPVDCTRKACKKNSKCAFNHRNLA